MNCDEAADLIGPYLDEGLAQLTRRRVEEHLLHCRDCAWEAQTLRITRDRLRDGAGEVMASDAFRARVLARLYADNPHVVEPEPGAAVEAHQYRLPMPL